MRNICQSNHGSLSSLNQRDDGQTLGTRSIQLWIRSTESPGKHRYENWTEKFSQMLTIHLTITVTYFQI